MPVHGKNAHFKLDNASNSLVDISSKLTSIQVPKSFDNPETTTFGKSAKTRLQGLEDNTISLSIMWDATIDAQITAAIAALKDGTMASLSFEYGPAGDDAGKRKVSGECVVAGYDVDEPVDGPVTATLELEAADEFTHGVWS
jgi:hypothetical protein